MPPRDLADRLEGLVCGFPLTMRAIPFEYRTPRELNGRLLLRELPWTGENVVIAGSLRVTEPG
jgi:hypothetical protein